MFGGYQHSKVDFSDDIRGQAGLGADAGKLGADNYSLGATYTNLAKSGAYLDLVGKLGGLRNHFNNSDSGAATQDGLQGIVSAEVGKPVYTLPFNWQIEPQAQLIYQYNAYQGFNDNAAQVKGYGVDQLRGRIGARLLKDHNFGGKQNNYYLVGNLIRDFFAPNSVRVAGQEVNQHYDRTVGEVGVGLQSHLSSNAFVYTDLRFDRSFSGNTENWQGNIGMKLEW